MQPSPEQVQSDAAIAAIILIARIASIIVTLIVSWFVIRSAVYHGVSRAMREQRPVPPKLTPTDFDIR
jgi:hypothetical protein